MMPHTDHVRPTDEASMASASPAESPSLRGTDASSQENGESQTSMSELGDGSLDGSIPDIGLDGDDTDPIVVCGLSVKFPQDATSSEGLWKMMMEKRCAMTEFPIERTNPKGFYQKEKRLNTLPLRGGHFLKEDLSLFDADFFGISPTEAAAMDPMQRWLLEAAYGALENAGIPMESISGSSTGVYTGSFGLDYMLQLTRDAEFPPTYAAVGFGLSMLANRISWFFNLHGPSIGLDSACSSSAMAVDIACQALRSGSCKMAMVAGSNLANSPEPYVWMSNLSFLSPDSKCHSFDHRANGYARGEGIGVVVLKRLSEAIRDGNTIRAVIRSTGSNEDGKTPGITQPSREAQERLIRETYQKAGLSMAHTRFFEAHGTGTPMGDPREAQAIGMAFQKYRSINDPLYVGAIKSNIGHLEGASGMAGLIKAIMVLEKGVIPPNTNFEKVNSKIDTAFLRIKFPQNAQLWPTQGLRRASVNSFGYGGANSHIILDDAYNYLRLRSLPGKHNTVPYPRRISALPPPLLDPYSSEHEDLAKRDMPPKLLVFSVADKNGVSRIAQSYQDWFDSAKLAQAYSGGDFVGDLAYTLDSHRSHLSWTSFALVSSPEDLQGLQSRMSAPVRKRPESPRLGFVFSGQGAQWFAMGRELMGYSSFGEELAQAGEYLKSLGCYWSVIDELLKPENESNVDRAEFSQALCTILQIALVNLLRKFKVRPSSVVGHSSGEIAAAYAAGYLSRKSAWKVAYFRGICSAELSEATDSQPQGSMMSVGLPEAEARELIATINQDGTMFGVSIACVNSPVNVTISGEDQLIDLLKAQLDEKKVFARKLRVALAYHSLQMEAISAKYKSMLGSLSAPLTDTSIPMISSVTGARASADRLIDPSYWALNMVSPVEFSRAVTAMCAQSPGEVVKKIDRSHTFASTVDHLLEIGPHAALQGPLRDILRASPRGKSIGYSSLLRRGQTATDTMLRAVGELHCMGSSVDLRVINEPHTDDAVSRSMLVDLPAYPFDHSQGYWHESRLSRNYRLREHAPSELLGVRSRDWNSADARWRLFLRTSEMPWAEQHVVTGTILYPGAGMLVMAIEAAKQLASPSGEIDGYTLRDVTIDGAMDLTASAGVLEVQTSLRELPSGPSGPSYEFVIRSYYNDDWRLNCRGSIAVDLTDASDDWNKSKTLAQRQEIASELNEMLSTCQTPVDSQYMYKFLEDSGYNYGSNFQATRGWCNEDTKQATSEVKLFSSTEEPHVVHPASLDTILHLCFTAFTAGGTQPMATCIPTRIGSLWISNSGLSSPETNSVMSCSTITSVSKRGFTFEGGALGSGSSQPKLWFTDVDVTNVSSAPPPSPESSSLPDPKQFAMSIDSKVALNKLSPTETVSYLDSLHPQQDLSQFYRDLELLALVSLDDLSSSVDPSTFDGKESWMKHYWNWAQHHLDNSRLVREWDDPQSEIAQARYSLPELTERLANTNHVGRLYATVASNLPALLQGETSPLDLLMQSGLLKVYYEELATYRDNTEAASYVDLLAHQAPGMKILEVGGGTASSTRNFIRALSSGQSDSTTSLRCERYDFTDVSSAFLGKAREEFSRFQSQMNFGTLDVERPFAEQGYEEGIYDVVVADNVLHVTSDLAQTLKNVRKALKPGGKLIMHELLRPDGWTAGYIFGLFPGWWLAAENDIARSLSPNLSADEWDRILKANGFSGAEMVFKDFDDEVAHHLGSVVATAIDEEAPAHTQQSRQVSIIADPASQKQQTLAKTLLSLEDVFGMKPRVQDLEAAASSPESRSKDDLVILLLDYGASFLSSLNATGWNSLKTLIQSSNRMLWVSAGGGKGASPDHGILDGLARTLRFEYYELQLVTMALDITDSSTSKSSHLIKVAQEMASTTLGQNYEQDYVEIEGRLHTRRLVEAQHVKTDMESRLMPYEVKPILAGEARFEVSNTSSTSLESGPYYVESPEVSELESDAVEISVKAVSLGSRDRTAAHNHEQQSAFGEYCAGVVLRAGPMATFAAGDRVLAVQAGSFRSHVCVSSNLVVALSPDVSFREACSVVLPFVDAHEALIQAGRTRPGDSVLVHDGASPIGQAALRLLSDQGITDVWATASDEKESASILAFIKMSEEKILPKSRFDGCSMLASQWNRKFDIVLSPYADSTAQVSMKCVKSGGRYIMLRGAKHDNSQQIHGVPPSISLSIIEPGAQSPSGECLRYAAGQASGETKNINHGAIEFPVSDLTTAFTRLQHAGAAESIVITFNESDVVDVRMANRPKYALSTEATYLVAGGLGGLGREVARWLTRRGARHLILLSRSGPRTSEATGLVEELESQGVQVATPACDVTDKDRLRSVLDTCSESMPPVKGCVQASMVMSERIFQQVEYEDWKATIDPKTRGSWNLHTELPNGLDFFVFTSSMMGIMGSGSLAAYNAGNTYEDALAHYRVSHGEHAVALNLGAIPDAGYLVKAQEKKAHIANTMKSEKFALTWVKDVCALLDVACDPSSTLPRDTASCQAVVGIRPISHWKHAAEVHTTMHQPFWGHMHHFPAVPELMGSGGMQNKKVVDVADRLAAAGSLSESAEVISEALAQRVSVLLGASEDSLDAQMPMHSYGIDSLSAIEVRNWVGKMFDVDMPVFEILGGATFDNAGMSIARKVQTKNRG